MSFTEAYRGWDADERERMGHAFPSVVLAAIEELLPSKVQASAETGCGKSTIVFSNLSEEHTVFCLDDRAEGENSSVTFFQSCPLTRLDRIKTVFGPTQLTLPKHDFKSPLDFVLIDGQHAYPFPDIEYFYFYPHIRPGGLLIVDDANIPTIGRMCDVIAEDDMFDLVTVISRTAVFQRTSAPLFDPFGDGWWTQRYNRRRVSESRAIFLDDGPFSDILTSMGLDREITG